MNRFLALGLLLCSSTFGAGRWESTYFYDHAREVLEFTDIASPSTQRTVAVGSIHDSLGERRDRHIAVVTSDGGDHWQQVKLDDAPVSLFFLDDSTGWLVTEGAIWRTDEAGRAWTRVSKIGRQQILRLWFLDSNYGFGVGAKKNVVVTKDGGRTWTKVPGTKNAPGDPNLSFYTRITFVDKKNGIIVGSDLSSLGPRLRARSTTRILQLQTTDGGATWQPKAGPSGGLVHELKFNQDGGLLLILFSDRSGNDISNVFHLPLRGSTPASAVYESKDLRITDLALYPDRAYLVGVQNANNPLLEEVPRKVRILESRGLKLWNEMEVDYNAEAKHMILAGADADHVFVATDQGMILRLKR